MSSPITLTRFQTLTPSPGDTESAEPVGHDGLAVDGDPSAHPLHISPSNAGAGSLCDVRINGSLLHRLTRQQVEHLSLAPGTRAPLAAGSSTALVTPQPAANGTAPGDFLAAKLGRHYPGVARWEAIVLKRGVS
jgi:hypothetical protein